MLKIDDVEVLQKDVEELRKLPISTLAEEHVVWMMVTEYVLLSTYWVE